MRIAKFSPLLVVLAGCLWFLVSAKNVPQKPKDQQSIHVEVSQLTEQSGIQLHCDDAKLMGTGRIEELSCVIKNNTFAPMVAGTIKTEIIMVESGRDNLISNYQTFDTSLISAFQRDQPKNQIQPGKDYRFYQPPIDFGNGIVKRIQVEIDFIEFADKSGLGPNNAGTRILGGMRNGASKYKDWLTKEYKEKGDAVVVDEIANESSSASEVGLQGDDEISGANMYRKHLRRIYKSKGREEILKHLKQG